jgi:hypothetical protein
VARLVTEGSWESAVPRNGQNWVKVGYAAASYRRGASAVRGPAMGVLKGPCSVGTLARSRGHTGIDGERPLCP